MEIKEVLEIVELMKAKKTQPKHPLTVGKSYFIRTVTHYYTGVLKEVCGQWLILGDAAWIADTGRFHEFLKEGKCNEYEGFIEDVCIPIGGVVDISIWQHKLFRGQK
jgi:hypothetical protein